MEYDALADLASADPEFLLAPALTDLAGKGGKVVDEALSDLCVRLAARGAMPAAEQIAIRASRELDFPNGRFLDLLWELVSRDGAFLSCDLFHYYVKNGGDDREAFEYSIGQFFRQNNLKMVAWTHRQAKRWFDPMTLTNYPLFCVATALVTEGDPRLAFQMYEELLRRDPALPGCRENIRVLARFMAVPEAVAFYAAESAEIAQSLPCFRVDDANKVQVVVDLAHQPADDVFEALNRFGVCHVRNGCDVAVARTVFARVQNDDHPYFPSVFVPDVVEALGGLFRFDAQDIVARTLGRPAALDVSSSTVRKVDPSDEDSFTPFHQDATAFQKLLVNIWTPLTPAGGEYPSIQFVTKRIQIAEQTMLERKNYNLIAIEDDHVFEKYGDLLYEITDAAPGDCVIFLGTTIHRSTNLAQATKPRFNLEVRWA